LHLLCTVSVHNHLWTNNAAEAFSCRHWIKEVSKEEVQGKEFVQGTHGQEEQDCLGDQTRALLQRKV
jgi:hypothetical protein